MYSTDNNTAENTQDHVAAVDDIAFVNCESTYKPPCKYVSVAVWIENVFHLS